MMRVGYARVSTFEQNTVLQKKALIAAGCIRIAEEKASGVKVRPVFEALIKTLKAGDILVVYKLDRLARSMVHFIRIFEDLKARGVAFESLTEKIETATPQGRMFLHLLSAFASYERDLIRERCHAGQLAAMARGQKWGVLPKFTESECKSLLSMVESGFFTVKILSEWFELPVSTIRDSIYRVTFRGRYVVKKLHK
jgi:DNA invertase Pin-like site-specific DNA recombinase